MLSNESSAAQIPDDERIPTCDCGHPQGWHRKNVGSCIECACPYFDDRDEAATDRSAARGRRGA